MRNLFALVIAALVFFSCGNDDDGFAKFEKDRYSLHYDQTIDLELTSSENASSFQYYLNTSNVIDIINGKAVGLYVGEVNVIAKYEDLRAECKVVVEPYEKLFVMLPLLAEGMNRAAVKFMETAIERDTLPGPQNVLIVTPSEDDPELETMEYYFENDGLVSISAFLKSSIAESRINLFMKERYPYREGIGYEDAGLKMKVSYNKEENKVLYNW